MAKQVVVIHGGETFDTYEDYLAWLTAYELDLEKGTTKRWKSTLAEELGEEYEVILPTMPNGFNAKYAEWKIWFEKHIPHLRDGVALVGHSLGGIFIAKYLSEETFPKSIASVHLVAAPFDTADANYSLADFVLPESLEKMAEQAARIYLYHSTDDPIVPFTDLAKYQSKLPYARTSIFADRDHFRMESFPELVADIQGLR
ncbi:MAG TPA: alpha/beta fold hydrolase [Candidatus Paceibacterota bacterium]|nr:alpha/beta fold hydrolase [Candidatus Paceibacterota bacterium]